MIKAITLIVLSLFSFSVTALSHNLTEVQKHLILKGNECCYNKEVIEEVLAEYQYITISEPEYFENIDFRHPSRHPPAEKWHWALFWTLQALDVYTTHRGMKYDCVYEVNPLLPERPTLPRLLIHKGVTLVPLQWIATVTEPSDEELLPATLLTSAVVLNNFQVIDRAKRNCNKIK